MNTIKIKLSLSGRVAALDKNFPLFQGQFANTLLNVSVPTAMLAADFEIQHYIGNYSSDKLYNDASLQDDLDNFVLAQTGRAAEASDVIFYTDTTNDKFYRAVYSGANWGFTEVPYFAMGNFAGTSVKIGVLAVARNGVQYKSKSYYMRYVKTYTANDGIEYAMYERKMPREFTAYEGQGQNAPTIIINVVNAIAGVGVENIVTSQTCNFDVMPSTQLDEDEPIESTAQEEIWGAINDIAEDLNKKQDKTDYALNTADKTIVGAINEVKTTADGANARSIDNADEIAKIKDGTTKVPSAAYADEAGFATNDSAGDNIATEFSGVKNRLTDLETIIGTGEHYVGTLTITTDIVPLPDPSTSLNNFVQTQDGRAPKGGDTVIIIQKISNATDKTYKYIFNGTAWIGFEIPPVEIAGNGTAGLVSGTYNIGSTNNILVDIDGGEIKNIWVKLGGSYANIVPLFESISGLFTRIINGTQIVGEAQKATRDSANNNIATQFANILNGIDKVGAAALADEALKATADALGNNIVNTYMTKTVGATKQYVKDYALPKQFNNVLYLSANGFSENIPITPASGVQFAVTSEAIGETVLATCEYELGDVKFQLARKNSYTARYYIGASVNTGETLQFKLATYAVINGVATLLHTELTTPKIIPATLDNFDFGEAFSELGNTVLELQEGDKIRQVFSVVRENSTSVTFNVYSNATYPSSFYLNTALQTLIVRETALGELPYIYADNTKITVQSLEYVQGDTVETVIVDISDSGIEDAIGQERNIAIALKLDFLNVTIANRATARLLLRIGESGNYHYISVVSRLHSPAIISDLVPASIEGTSAVEMIVVLQPMEAVDYPVSVAMAGEMAFLDIANIESVKGTSGTITLLADNWSNNTYTLSLAQLGTNNALFVTPSTTADQEAASNAGIFFEPNPQGITVTVTADTAPSTDISFEYFIARG